ncbi:DUF6443 domain-containing protein [Epilithonimonas pallida]|uniref:RHS repeat-associated core domain-containing protein n=1 Tax=Epilithonimonas pallida TaxID=373671 RepID=A0ABY1R9A2_9FLAO|nr:DUF6443 domain-containing protein [Epilithonimonas pallida]SMP97457.1 RHS repeat-associated core domain-containing protein [Epilithonimonas pallida]
MRKNKIPALLLLMPVAGLAQTVPSPGENYVFSTVCLDETCTRKTETIQYLDGLGRPKQILSVQASPLGNDIVLPVVYDGFGRQVTDYLPLPQSGTSFGKIYTHNPAADPPVSNPVYSSIFPTETTFYTKKVLEDSPLDRVRQQYHPGAAWSANPVAMDYAANLSTDKVMRFSTVTDWNDQNNNTLQTGTAKYYGSNMLYKNLALDEDGNKTTEFKNQQGQTVLIRRELAPNVNTDTYYIYNEYNQLAYVISPEASVKIDALQPGTNILNDAVTGPAIQELCYQYRYDGKSRLVEKKVPGKGWEYMVYDRADRLILTQDANLRAQGTWMITKYDQLGRPIYTGLMQGGTRSSMQSQAGSLIIVEAKDATGFTRNGLTAYYTYGYFGAPDTLLSVNYYDSYPPGTTFPAGDAVQSVPILKDTYPAGVNVSTKALPTASYVKNLEDDRWTRNYTFYDRKGRAIGTHSYNHLGGYTKNESVLDFAGLPQKTFTYHSRNSLTATSATIEQTFTYDAKNRLTRHEHKVNSQPTETLALNHYNELGQLDWKKVGGTGTALQTVDYRYNIRGWITSVNNPDNIAAMGTDVFGYRIRYNETIKGLPVPNVNFPGLQVTKRYNGNIAEVDWNSVNATGSQPRTAPYRFGYVYDGLNRLKAGFYQGQVNPSQRSYHEIVDQYDLNGNIQRLKRFGGTDKFGNVISMDDLVYLYSGNQVTHIDDVSGNMSGYEGGNGLIEYDANGNMVRMPDKGITNITYNILNLPSEIQQQNTTQYLYRADGVKLKKTFMLDNGTDITVTNTEYLDGFHYVTESAQVAQAFLQTDDNTLSARTAAEEEVFIENEAVVRPIDPGVTMALSFFPTAEGFYDFKKKQYIYQYKDHLGNVRLSYSWNAAINKLEILDRNDYYPFGMNFVAAGAGAVYDPKGSPLNYKFGTKELQETGMYDFGARFYMPDIGRWGVVDPLAEKNTRLTPYHYAANNPIRNIDPDGRMDINFTGEAAKEVFVQLRDSFNSKSSNNSTQRPNDWVKDSWGWHWNGEIKSREQAMKAGYFDYSDGRTNNVYTTPLGSNGKGVGRNQKVVLGLNRNFTINGEARLAPDTGAYISSKEMDKLAKVLSAPVYVPFFIMGGESVMFMKGSIDVLTQYGAKGSVDLKQTAITTFVPGYKWGIGLNFINNNYNSYNDNGGIIGVQNDFGKNTIKAGLSSVGGLGEFLKPGLSGNVLFQLSNQGVSNIGDATIDKTSNQDY